MGVNGTLRMYNLWEMSSSGNSKTVSVRNGFTNILTSFSNGGISGYSMFGEFSNRGVQNRNVFAYQGGAPFGVNSSALLTTIDTSADFVLKFVAEMDVASDFVILDSATIDLIK